MCASQNAKAWSLKRTGARGRVRRASHRIANGRGVGPLAHPKLAGLVGGRDDEHAAPQLDRELAEERDEHRAVPLLAVRARRREDRHLEDGVGRVHLDDRRGDRLAVWCVQDDLPPARELCAQADRVVVDLHLAQHALRLRPTGLGAAQREREVVGAGHGLRGAGERVERRRLRRVPLAPLRRGRLLALHLPRIVHADVVLLHLTVRDRGAVRPLRAAPHHQIVVAIVVRGGALGAARHRRSQVRGGQGGAPRRPSKILSGRIPTPPSDFAA